MSRQRDFSRLFGQALEKLEYPAWDIPRDEVNSIYSVVHPVGQIPGATMLLLPYCAKPPDCAYRQVDGCARCGRCSIDEGYRLAERYGLKPVCITNYEMLEHTLAEAKAQGARAFVGCCCEAFVAKHRSDFERIGLPGILIDIDDTTCYDLGQEREARAGRFDRQTSLKLGLLAAVLSRQETAGQDAG